jgi:hypothetical protein
MNRSGTNSSSDIAGSADLEPFNGCQEMLPITEFSDARTPQGPSQVILTARVGNHSVWTSTIKIPILNDRA